MNATTGMLVVLCLPVGGQPAAKDDTAPAPAAEMQGLWPTNRLIELMLRRWADEVKHEYDLDEEQAVSVEKRLVERWGGFLEHNRSTIQPLANEFIELRMDLTPPDKERVMAWAERVLPVLDLFRDQINEGANEFREILTPIQKAKFENDIMKLGAGIQIAKAKVKTWTKGDFDERDFWEPTRSERRKRRAEREKERAERDAAAESAESRPADQIGDEVRTWRAYVEEFVATYDLDDGQKGAARSILTELSDRALAHRDRNRREIDKLERKIAAHAERADVPYTGSSDGATSLAPLEAQLVKLYGPIDRMFEELETRLDAIPTQAQRQRVEKAASNPDDGDSNAPD